MRKIFIPIFAGIVVALGVCFGIYKYHNPSIPKEMKEFYGEWYGIATKHGCEYVKIFPDKIKFYDQDTRKYRRHNVLNTVYYIKYLDKITVDWNNRKKTLYAFKITSKKEINPFFSYFRKDEPEYFFLEKDYSDFADWKDIVRIYDTSYKESYEYLKQNNFGKTFMSWAGFSINDFCPNFD
jgi:hypothetical protein